MRTYLLDLAAIVGIATVGYGLDQVHRALGWIWFGSVLLVGALYVSHLNARVKRRQR